MRQIEVLETHISWVILAGDYAYKIKKPVNLGFLDFSSLASRKHFCEEELRLNRRLAPDLYLAVVPIAGTTDAPRIEGVGPILDYAVKMRRFEQSNLFDSILARGQLRHASVVALAQKIAAYHATAPNALTTPGVDPAAGIVSPALDNFAQVLPQLKSDPDRKLLMQLRTWTVAEHQHTARLLAERLLAGRMRECHGDLHLGNIALIDGEPTPFDCIEFNPVLRWIDTMSEAAFLVMDLTAHGHTDLAHVFLNAYLEASGDYQGLAVLRYYCVYRAMVRAKIALLRITQPECPVIRHADAMKHFKNYLSIGETFTRQRRPALVITHGQSGSGKTTLTQPLIAKLGAIRVRSDVERKRLHGLPAMARTSSMIGAGIYTVSTTREVYAQLLAHARHILDAGYTALIDATFLQHWQRDSFRRLARELRVPFILISVTAAGEVCRERIVNRHARGMDASEASVAVLDEQSISSEALGNDELDDAILIRSDTAGDSTEKVLDRELAQRLGILS